VVQQFYIQMTKTFFIETWGCQMNDLDSQRLSGSLKLRGYRRVETEAEADLILLNTCSIRDKSEQKVFSHLGRLREMKSERELQIGVCGCVGGHPPPCAVGRLRDGTRQRRPSRSDPVRRSPRGHRFSRRSQL
jgi:tRNA A37 methylthiotransferase MiaB